MKLFTNGWKNGQSGAHLMGNLENKLIWSSSRINTLDFCARKYYFSYYQSWGGWEYDASPETKKTYMLKNRQNIWGWIGDKTHEAIKKYLIIPKANENSIKKAVLHEMDLEFNQSRMKTYINGNLKTFGLIEHYYGKEVSDNEFIEIKERVMDNFEAFLKCKYLPGILELKNSKGGMRLLKVDPGQDFEKMRFQVSELNNTEIYALPDLYYELRENEYLILDWKTGEYRKEGEIPSVQLRAYGLRLQNVEKIDVNKNKVEALEVYLPDFKEIGSILNTDHMASIVIRIKEDLCRMESFLLDPRINTPKEKEYFEKTDCEGKCIGCQFQELCK